MILAFQPFGNCCVTCSSVSVKPLPRHRPLVPHARRQRRERLREPIAVLVEIVALDLHRAGPDRRVVVVAVLTGEEPVLVASIPLDRQRPPDRRRQAAARTTSIEIVAGADATPSRDTAEREAVGCRRNRRTGCRRPGRRTWSIVSARRPAVGLVTFSNVIASPLTSEHRERTLIAVLCGTSRSRTGRPERSPVETRRYHSTGTGVTVQAVVADPRLHRSPPENGENVSKPSKPAERSTLGSPPVVSRPPLTWYAPGRRCR